MVDVTLLDDSDWEWRRRGPTPEVIHAFDVHEDALRRHPGGAGHTEGQRQA